LREISAISPLLELIISGDIDSGTRKYVILIRPEATMKDEELSFIAHQLT
jgi:hypothetical protein